MAIKLLRQPANPLPLGAKRFLELEQKVSDIEKTMEIMREMLHVNNETLQSIMDAIERENARSS